MINSQPSVSESTGEVVSGGDTGGLASLGLGAPGKKFRCDKCTRAFVRRDALRRHRYILAKRGIHGPAFC